MDATVIQLSYFRVDHDERGKGERSGTILHYTDSSSHSNLGGYGGIEGVDSVVVTRRHALDFKWETRRDAGCSPPHNVFMKRVLVGETKSQVKVDARRGYLS